MEGRRSEISILKALHCSWVDFMTHTSMHGVRYICEDGRKFVEKIFWSIVVTSGIISTAFMVKGIYVRYSSRPTMSIIEYTHHPTWVFPFPGVTICNNNRIMKSKAEALVQQLVLPKGVTAEEILQDFKLLGALKNPEFIEERRFKRLQKILDDNRYTITGLMFKLGQTCEEMFDKCSWESRVINCSEIFEIRKSHHGFCCSFNHLGVTDHRNKKHGTLLYKVEGEPRRTLFYGPDFGLTVLVNPMLHEYFLTDYAATGITVLVHHPEDYPDETVAETMIGIGKETLMPITVSTLYCTDDVRQLPISVRSCVFEDEQPLQFFPEYRYRSCIAECMMNRTIEFCGCIPYYYPDNGVYQTCDLNDVQCLYDHFQKLYSRKPPKPEKNVFDHTDEDEIHVWKGMVNTTTCNCPKPCDIISYRPEANTGDFQGTFYSIDPILNAGSNTTDRILLHVYMETDFGKLIKRDIATSLSDLISTLGGVVCLFLGCSFVTFVEILYFFTIRLRLRKDKAPKKQVASCPLTPRAIKEARYPSVKKQTLRTIRVKPQKDKSANKESEIN